MSDQIALKEIFNLYDEEADGKIDGTQIGDVLRATGLKPTNAMISKAFGESYKQKGEKRMSFEEFLKIYEQISKEKPIGSYTEFCEGFKVFDNDECGKIFLAQIRHSLLNLGEPLTKNEFEEFLSITGVEIDREGMIKYEPLVIKVMDGLTQGKNEVIDFAD